MTSIVLQRLQEPGRAVAIASVMGVSESTVSRLKNEHLESLYEIMDYLHERMDAQRYHGGQSIGQFLASGAR